MKIKFIDFIFIILLSVLVLLFFLPLFYPQAKLYVTPGYSESDIVHLNYPLKELLAQSLKQNRLPIWTDLIGTGVPLIAESQIETFSMLNILLFKFFPVLIAFNLGYVISFLLLALGMYAVARNEGYSPVVAFITGFMFTFSGAHIVRIHHYNILLGSVYVPFIFLCCRRIMKNTNSHAWLFLPFLVSQYILSTHLPSVFVTLLFFLFLFIASLYKRLVSLNKTMITKGVIILLLSIGLASIQLLPTYEYFLNSNRESNVSLFNTSHSGLSLDNIIQFISPYSLGDIRSGTYSSQVNRPIFWEAFSYIGLIPFLLALFTLKNIRSKNINISVYWITIGILFLLALEGNAPWYLLYSLPPFSFFRIYSRLIYPISFLLVLLFGYSLQEISNSIRKHRTILFTVMSGVILLSMIDVWQFANSYNPTEPADSIFKKPLTANYLSQFRQPRVYSVGIDSMWLQYFSKYGWKQIDPYGYLRNGLNADVNILYNIPVIDMNSGFQLKNHNRISSMINEGINFEQNSNLATYSNRAIHTLELLGVNVVISPFRFTNLELETIFTAKSPFQNLNNIFVYQLTSSKPLYYLAHHPDTASGVREITQNLNSDSWPLSYDAILSSNTLAPHDPTEKLNNDTISEIMYTDTQKTFRYQSNTDGYFMLLTYFYPGWEAKVDGVKAPIVSGNISSMAVFAPKGSHRIEFTFVPKSLYLGAIVSGISVVFYCAFIILQVRRKQA